MIIMKFIRKLRRIAGIICRNFKFTFFEEVRRELLSPKLPKTQNSKIYIHLGCGPINAEGFINVDALPYSHIHYIQQIDDLNIFPDKYADLIYASHVLEHLSYNNIPRILKEWHRVLKKGGILRISVPDFDKLIGIYSSEQRDIKTIIGPLMGGQDYEFNYHKTVFNEKYLKELLLLTGFKEVKQWDPKKVEMHPFEDWASRPIKVNAREYPISLNIEAVK